MGHDFYVEHRWVTVLRASMLTLYCLVTLAMVAAVEARCARFEGARSTTVTA